MPEQTFQEQIEEVTTQTEEDYGAQLPEHVILRFCPVPTTQDSRGFRKEG